MNNTSDFIPQLVVYYAYKGAKKDNDKYHYKREVIRDKQQTQIIEDEKQAANQYKELFLIAAILIIIVIALYLILKK